MGTEAARTAQRASKRTFTQEYKSGCSLTLTLGSKDRPEQGEAHLSYQFCVEVYAKYEYEYEYSKYLAATN